MSHLARKSLLTIAFCIIFRGASHGHVHFGQNPYFSFFVFVVSILLFFLLVWGCPLGCELRNVFLWRHLGNTVFRLSSFFNQNLDRSVKKLIGPVKILTGLARWVPCRQRFFIPPWQHFRVYKFFIPPNTFRQDFCLVKDFCLIIDF